VGRQRTQPASRGISRLIAGLADRRLRILLTATGTLALVGAPISVAAAPSNLIPGEVDASVLSSAPTGVVVSSGQLLGGNGSPVSGTVAALAWPTSTNLKKLHSGQSVAVPTVGWAVAGADGQFSLRVDAKRVTSQYRTASGEVNLEVIGWAAGLEGITFEPVLLKSSSAGDAAANGTTDHVAVTLSHAFSKGTPAGSLTSSRGGPESPDVSCQPTLDGASIVRNTEVGDTFVDPYESNYAWLVTSGSSSHSYSFGVGVSTSGTSFSDSGSTSSSATIGMDWGSNPYSFTHDSHYYTMATQYQEYHWTGDCSEYEWESLGLTGGTGNTTTNWIVFGKPQYCQSVGSGLWDRENQGGASFSLGGGVLIANKIGINLSISTSYSGSRIMYYHVSGTDVLCGDNAFPATAGQVGED
jgi:hypothetical protein